MWQEDMSGWKNDDEIAEYLCDMEEGANLFFDCLSDSPQYSEEFKPTYLKIINSLFEQLELDFRAVDVRKAGDDNFDWLLENIK